MTACLAAAHSTLDLPAWTAAPFVLLLLAIAFVPLAFGHWWHANRHKGYIVLALAAPVVLYLLAINGRSEGESIARLLHELSEYASFIILLLALYTISGGVILYGDIQGRPLTNTGFLALGAVLANFVGTTGASMLLIRPVLRINSQRERKSHIPIFFIFIVSNVGGLLTPLGDPPLFLGFLKGVDFFWTLRLVPEWLFVNLSLLAIFYIWDRMAYAREPERAIRADIAEVTPLRLVGWLPTMIFLAGVLIAVVLQSERVGQGLGNLLGVGDCTLVKPYGEIIMLTMVALSLLFTPRSVRVNNQFEWGPIVEVAVLFLGIFITMVPALALLETHGHEFGITKPWEFFWLTGWLSSFLDNAPTYVTFATLAAEGNSFDWLANNRPEILTAISCGAVFMGANTYIGNGPNFMVKAIAESSGYRMPSFFGYMFYSVGILVPLFVIVTFLMIG